MEQKAAFVKGEGIVMYPTHCYNIANNCEIGEKCECGEIMWKVNYATDMIDYAEKTPIGNFIDDPGLYELTQNTILYLKRYIKGITS